MKSASKHGIPTDYSALNKVQLIRGGKEYFDLLVHLINEATESIHLQTYIYANDETGARIATALKAAAKRKVQVYLLADGYASQTLSQKLISELSEAGVNFRFFEPLLKSKHFYFGRRMHHKIFVADAEFAVVGGINIANRYNEMPGNPSIQIPYFIRICKSRQSAQSRSKSENIFYLQTAALNIKVED